MAKKTKAKILIILGILGIAFICTWDIITGKAVNDISGPRSIAVLVISGLMLILGVIKAKSKN